MNNFYSEILEWDINVGYVRAPNFEIRSLAYRIPQNIWGNQGYWHRSLKAEFAYEMQSTYKIEWKVGDNDCMFGFPISSTSNSFLKVQLSLEFQTPLVQKYKTT